MPFTFLSHQAPVIPLKIARPRWFSGTALAIGSMAPDLEYFVRLQPYREISHTLRGQLLFCLPVTLALVWLVTRVLARPLARHLPQGGELHLERYQLLEEEARGPGYWWKVPHSALLGSFSHIVWDGFTHPHGWFVRRLPPLQTVLWHHGTHFIYVSTLLQHLSTVGGALATLWLLREIGRRGLWRQWLPGVALQAPASPAEVRRFWQRVLAAVPLGLLAGFSRMAGFQDRPSGPGYLWNPVLWSDEHVWLAMGFGAVTFAFLGLCLSCLLARRQMK